MTTKRAPNRLNGPDWLQDVSNTDSHVGDAHNVSLGRGPCLFLPGVKRCSAEMSCPPSESSRAGTMQSRRSEVGPHPGRRSQRYGDHRRQVCHNRNAASSSLERVRCQHHRATVTSTLWQPTESGPRRFSRWHLAWSLPVGLLLGLIGFVLAFFAWCGTERCAITDPAEYQLDTAVAMVVTFVAGFAGGTVNFLAPWSARRWPRLCLASVVAVLPLVLAAWYVMHFTAR